MATKTVKKISRVVLGVTGGIAAYKSAELTRLLRKADIEVQVVMTEAGSKFITQVTMQALSGNPVFIDAWDSRIANNMAHIELSRAADAILIAPASADFIAKLASGFADDLLSTLVLARQPTCTLLVAPAMNREMWENPATQRNVARLLADGVTILGPDLGEQACGETGMGRMLEPSALLDAILGLSANGSLSGKHALVTAGPTFEPIDPVRGITNSSSGKMGYAIVEALTAAGANVTLISGPTAIAPPTCTKFLRVGTASQMLEAVKVNLAGVDMFFSVAAVADYTPVAPQIHKIKKADTNLSIEMVPTVDILRWVAAQNDPPFCIGFAAESDNVVEYAIKKRKNKGIPLIVANLATTAIGSDENEITLIDDAGEHLVPKGPKTAIAKIIVEHAARLLSQQSPQKPTLKSVKHA